MDSREFVAMTKQYAVDDVVDACVTELRVPKPKLQDVPPFPRGPMEESISRWIDEHALVKRQRSEWFNRLTTHDQNFIRDILRDCAEKVLGNFFCFVDGVGGDYEGVFEIVSVESSNRRDVINPQNTEMLHDIFSELCEEDRQGG